MGEKPKIPRTDDEKSIRRWRTGLLNWINFNAGFAFAIINTPTGTNPVADDTQDTLNMTSGNNILTITGTAANDTVDYTINQGNIDHGSLAGLGDDDHTQYGHLNQAESVLQQWNWTSGGPKLNDNIPLTIGNTNPVTLEYDTDSLNRVHLDLNTSNVDFSIGTADGNNNTFFVDEDINWIGIGKSSSLLAKLHVESTNEATIKTVANKTANGSINMFRADLKASGSIAMDVLTAFENNVEYAGDAATIGTLRGAINNIVFKSTEGVGTTTVATALGAEFSISKGTNNTQNFTFTNMAKIINLKSARGGAAGDIDFQNGLVGLYIQNFLINNQVADTGDNTAIWLERQTSSAINGGTDRGIVLDGDGAGSNAVFGANQESDISFNGTDLAFTSSDGFDFKSKMKLTAIGGYAIKLTNTTGAVTVKGQTVKADTATDDAVILTAADDDECFGVFLDAGVADDAEAWVVIAGIADVAMGDNELATHGNWVETNSTEAGYADATSTTPAAAPQHFNEIGHCIQNVAAGGGGTHILARCVLHFN